MAKKKVESRKVEIVSNECCGHKHVCKGGAIYGLGFIGAAVYYISTATGFWNGVWGFIKAIVWPAFLVFGLFKFLGL